LDKTQNVLNIQPVYPVNLNSDWNLITRTIFPLISQPATAPGQDREFGLGDIQFSAFFSPINPTAGGTTWGVGAIAQLDSASDDRLGQGAWGLGPTAVALKFAGPWVYGGLVNNVWSVSEDAGRQKVNQFLLQPFVNYNFPQYRGRYLSFAPIITANWEADSGNKWTVPFGGGVGRVLRIGDFPIDFSLKAFGNVENRRSLQHDPSGHGSNVVERSMVLSTRDTSCRRPHYRRVRCRQGRNPDWSRR
jgi:hypothetical protein